MAGKKIAFFGDSLGRQQFQSLVCALSSDLQGGGGQTVTDISPFWRERGVNVLYGYLFSPSRITVLLGWSITLCQVEPVDPARREAGTALHLDRLALSLKHAVGKVDVMVLNTGHHMSIYKFHLYNFMAYIGGRPIEMPTMSDLRGIILRNVALQLDALLRKKAAQRATWQGQWQQLADSNWLPGENATGPLGLPRSSTPSNADGSGGLWAERRRPIDARVEGHGMGEAGRMNNSSVSGRGPKVPVIYMRTFSPEHFASGAWNTGGRCDHYRDGIKEKHEAVGDMFLGPSTDPQMEAAVNGTSIKILDITGLSVVRPEMHPAADRPQRLQNGSNSLEQQDCSHWCLPGIPDTWNEILLADILANHFF